MRAEVIATGLTEAIARTRGAKKAIHSRWRRSLYRRGAEAIRFIKRVPRGSGETTDSATAVRSGRLRNAYGHEVVDGGDALELNVGVIKASSEVLSYAKIHEYGGTIRAKNGSYLTIPLPAALTANGVLRAPAREWPNTFLIKEWMIIAQRQADGIIVPLFKLKREVKIKARPALEPARKLIEPKLVADLRDDVIDAMEAKS